MEVFQKTIHLLCKRKTLKAVYSYGHRNPQGMTIHPKTGEIGRMNTDQGRRRNKYCSKEGKNYGWPVITYGINYSGTSITEKKSMPGMEQPFYYWVPSIAPSGMAFQLKCLQKMERRSFCRIFKI